MRELDDADKSALLSQVGRAATLRAVEPVHALVIEADEIDSVLAADPSSTTRLGRRRTTD